MKPWTRISVMAASLVIIALVGGPNSAAGGNQCHVCVGECSETMGSVDCSAHCGDEPFHSCHEDTHNWCQQAWQNDIVLCWDEES